MFSRCFHKKSRLLLGGIKVDHSLELLYDLVVKPRQTLECIKETASLGHAALILLLCSILNSLGLFSGDISIFLKSFLLLLFVIYTLANWVITVGILHGMAHLVGGHGSYKDMLKLAGFSSFITLFMVPCYLIDLFSPDLGALLFCVVGVLLFLWSVLLSILSISINYGLSVFRAALAYSLPLAFLAAVVLVIFFFCLSLFGEIIHSVGGMDNILENAVRL